LEIHTSVNIGCKQVVYDGTLRIGELDDGKHKLNSTRDILRIVWVEKFGDGHFIEGRLPYEVPCEHH
jgi:hypothetical protein